MTDHQAIPGGCAIMEAVSEQTQEALKQAGDRYERARQEMDEARQELTAAIITERQAGTKIEDLAALVPIRQSQVNRILEAAGLTTKRTPRQH